MHVRIKNEKGEMKINRTENCCKLHGPVIKIIVEISVKSDLKNRKVQSTEILEDKGNRTSEI